MFKAIIQGIKKPRSKSVKDEQEVEDVQCKTSTDLQLKKLYNRVKNPTRFSTKNITERLPVSPVNVVHNRPKTVTSRNSQLRSTRSASVSVCDLDRKSGNHGSLQEADVVGLSQTTRWLSMLRFHSVDEEDDLGDHFTRPVSLNCLTPSQAFHSSGNQLTDEDVFLRMSRQHGESEVTGAERVHLPVVSGKGIPDAAPPCHKYPSGRKVTTDNMGFLTKQNLNIRNDSVTSSETSVGLNKADVVGPAITADTGYRQQSLSAVESELYLLSGSFLNDSNCTYVSFFNHSLPHSRSFPEGDVMIEEDYTLESILSEDCHDNGNSSLNQNGQEIAKCNPEFSGDLSDELQPNYYEPVSSVLSQQIPDAETFSALENDWNTPSEMVFTIWRNTEGTMNKVIIPITKQMNVSELIEMVLSTDNMEEDCNLYSLVAVNDDRIFENQTISREELVSRIKLNFCANKGWHFKLQKDEGIQVQIILYLSGQKLTDPRGITVSRKSTCRELLLLAVRLFNLSSCTSKHSDLVLMDKANWKMVQEHEVLASLSTNCFLLGEQDVLIDGILEGLVLEGNTNDVFSGEHLGRNSREENTGQVISQDSSILDSVVSDEISTDTSDVMPTLVPATMLDEMQEVLNHKDSLLESLEQEKTALVLKLAEVSEQRIAASSLYDAVRCMQDQAVVVNLMLPKKSDGSLGFMIGLDTDDKPIVKRCEPGIPLQKYDRFLEVNGVPVFDLSEKMLYKVLMSNMSSDTKMVVLRKDSSEGEICSSSEVQGLKDDLSLTLMELEIVQHENQDLGREVEELKEVVQKCETRQKLMETELEVLKTAVEEYQVLWKLVQETLPWNGEPEEFMRRFKQLMNCQTSTLIMNEEMHARSSIFLL